MTSWTCGPITEITGDKVTFQAPSSHGDSGAPVVATWPDGKITAVGILDGSPTGDDSLIVAQLVAPWMDAWSLRLTG